MMKMQVLSFGVAVLLSALVGTAQAATVQFTENNPIVKNPGQTFTLSLVGSGFTPPAQSGSFRFSWDTSVLDYVGTSFTGSSWDTSVASDSGAKAGTSNQVSVLVLSLNSAIGPDFRIGDVTFQYVGTAGSSSPINFANVVWTDASTKQISVT